MCPPKAPNEEISATHTDVNKVQADVCNILQHHPYIEVYRNVVYRHRNRLATQQKTYDNPPLLLRVFVAANGWLSVAVLDGLTAYDVCSAFPFSLFYSSHTPPLTSTVIRHFTIHSGATSRTVPSPHWCVVGAGGGGYFPWLNPMTSHHGMAVSSIHRTSHLAPTSTNTLSTHVVGHQITSDVALLALLSLPSSMPCLACSCFSVLASGKRYVAPR